MIFEKKKLNTDLKNMISIYFLQSYGVTHLEAYTEILQGEGASYCLTSQVGGGGGELNHI